LSESGNVIHSVVNPILSNSFLRMSPGFYTGYGVKTLPGIREAIEQRNWKEAQDQISIDAMAINRLSNYLMNATK